jgi:Fic family protein
MQQVSDFEEHARKVLGQDNPALGPMRSILLRTESASSSQIERLTASAKQIALAELGEQSRSNSKAIVGNVRAMEAALSLANNIGESSILEMHRALMTDQAGLENHEIGSFRIEQVWIGGGSAGPIQADFIPPRHERIPELMQDLTNFLKREDLPVLVQAAVGHAQFETIHPFVDGNGRTGRALVHSLFRSRGLTASNALPLSAGLLTTTSRYFDALGSYREGDAGPIVFEFAEAARFAAVTGKTLIENLADELAKSSQLLSGVRSDASARKILPLLIAHPVINTGILQESFGFGEMASLRALDLLVSRGILRELTGKRRKRIWQHSGILNILDDYAKKLKRASLRS